jgi:hypothetical protein
MKLACLLACLGLMVFGQRARALSPLREINPKSLDHLPLAFDIHSERLASGEIQFTVTITERAFKFGSECITALSEVHITEFSQSSRRIRKLAAEHQGNSMTCVFIVTDKDLEDPDLAFYFGTLSPETHIPSIDHFYARLTNFMKP